LTIRGRESRRRGDQSVRAVRAGPQARRRDEHAVAERRSSKKRSARASWMRTVRHPPNCATLQLPRCWSAMPFSSRAAFRAIAVDSAANRTMCLNTEVRAPSGWCGRMVLAHGGGRVERDVAAVRRVLAGEVFNRLRVTLGASEAALRRAARVDLRRIRRQRGGSCAFGGRRFLLNGRHASARARQCCAAHARSLNCRLISPAAFPRRRQAADGCAALRLAMCGVSSDERLYCASSCSAELRGDLFNRARAIESAKRHSSAEPSRPNCSCRDCLLPELCAIC